MAEYDVVVVGAGSNGLIAAAYLAKAGLNVCLVEKQAFVGGGALTREIDYREYHELCVTRGLSITNEDRIPSLHVLLWVSDPI